MLGRMTERRWVIGVDGGGTGCRARLEQLEGHVLGTGSGGPAAIRFGIDRSIAAVQQACLAALADAKLPREALAAMDAAIGLAGLGRQGIAARLAELPHPFRSIQFVEDATIACIGAHGGRDGGVVIAGTGSVGVALIEGRMVRVGGYGFPISDEGSGADLGLQAVRLALRAHDGRTVATDLAHRIMADFGNDPFEVGDWMDRATATDYATFAPLVIRCAREGDPAARGIVREAAGLIGDIVLRLVEMGAPRVALSGGLAPSLEPWLEPDVRSLLSPLQGDALSGALTLARRAAVGRKG
jgi:glucosamine kinase